MIRILIAAVLVVIANTSAFAWANVVDECCPAGQPGPAYCSCFWCTDVNSKVPGSDWCGEEINTGGGCILDADCHNTLSGLGTGPSVFPPFNLSISFVPLNFWGW